MTESLSLYGRKLLGAAGALALLLGHGQALAACDAQNFKIVLDVGHALNAGGAVSARGVVEFEFNRALASDIKAKLQRAGFAKVELNLLQRENLPSRPIRAKNFGADVFLSIHHDSVQPKYLSQWSDEGGVVRKYSDDFSGSSLFVSRLSADYPSSLALAQTIGAELTRRGRPFSEHHGEAIAGENRLLLDPRHGVYAHDHLIVLKGATMPAALLEAGVIVNRQEEAWLSSPQGRGELASAVATGLRNYCEAVSNVD